MKQVLILIPVLLLFAACENDFNANDNWQDTNVIYGLLDPEADTNWIRIGHGYLGTSAASASFNTPDSLYYENIVAYLKAFEITSQNRTGKQVDSIFLERDDSSRKLNDNGPFTTEGYRLYRTIQPLNENLRYELTVKKNDPKFLEAKATTDLLKTSEFRFLKPLPPTNTSQSKFDSRVNFFDVEGATLYKIELYFTYKEFDLTTKSSEIKTVKLDYGSKTATATTKQIEYEPGLAYFYNLLAGKIPVDENKIRFFHEIGINVWAADENLVKYMELSEPSTGIVQNKPELPNIENGTGLLASRSLLSLEGVALADNIAKEYYLSKLICDRQFAVAEAQDTFTCANYGLGPEKINIDKL